MSGRKRYGHKIMVVLLVIMVLAAVTVLRPFTWMADTAITDLLQYDLDTERETAAHEVTPGEYLAHEEVQTPSSSDFVAVETSDSNEDHEEQEEAATADVVYSVTTPTNVEVVASLVNPEKEITIVRGELVSGDIDSIMMTEENTVVFMDNGEYMIEFCDEDGREGQIVAKVDWIDKIPPRAVVIYSTTEETDGEVVAKVVRPSEVEDMGDEDGEVVSDEVFYVMNNNGEDEYAFTENGSFVFEIRDEAGNEAAVLATVDWITEVEQPETPENPGEGDDNTVEVPENPDDNEQATGGDYIESGAGVNSDSTSGELQLMYNDNNQGYQSSQNNQESQDGQGIANSESKQDVQGSQVADNSASASWDDGSETNNIDSVVDGMVATVDGGELEDEVTEATESDDNESNKIPVVDTKKGNNTESETKEEPWYRNEAVLWGAGGVIVVVVLVGVGMVNSRRK